MKPFLGRPPTFDSRLLGCTCRFRGASSRLDWSACSICTAGMRLTLESSKLYLRCKRHWPGALSLAALFVPVPSESSNQIWQRSGRLAVSMLSADAAPDIDTYLTPEPRMRGRIFSSSTPFCCTSIYSFLYIHSFISIPAFIHFLVSPIIYARLQRM